MTARNMPCGGFDPNYCIDGKVDTSKRDDPKLRDVNRTINNGREMLLEKIRSKLNN
jgi:hypothetical protein